MAEKVADTLDERVSALESVPAELNDAETVLVIEALWQLDAVELVDAVRESDGDADVESVSVGDADCEGDAE